MVRVWDVHSHALLATSPVTGVSLSGDGMLVASGGMDGTVRLWRPSTGQPAMLAHTGVVFGVALSADGRLLATAELIERSVCGTRRPGRCWPALEGHTA